MSGYDYDELFPGRFLKSGQFKGKAVTLTIADVRIEKMPDKNKERTKGILMFRETELELVLNKTNGECLKGMFGRRTDDWKGKRVSFCPEEVQAFGAMELAIRVLGSPDIEREMKVEIRLGQKSTSRVMKKTTVAAKPQAQQAPPPKPALPTEADPTTGEVPFVDGEGLPA
jgi:hypothetical protein